MGQDVQSPVLTSSCPSSVIDLSSRESDTWTLRGHHKSGPHAHRAITGEQENPCDLSEDHGEWTEWAACRSLLRSQPSSHPDTLDYLDEQEIDQRRSRKEEEVQAGQWHEFERHGQRGKRKNQAERHNREHCDCQRQAWATAEWVARGADDKQDQRLRCEGFNKPPRIEKRLSGAGKDQPHKTTGSVNTPTHRPN